MEGPQKTADRLDLARMLGQRAWLVIGCAVVVAGLAYVLSERRDARYEATTLLRLVADSGPALPGRQGEPQPGTDTPTTLVGTRAATRRAAARVGISPARAKVVVDEVEDSNVIRVTASAPQPRAAAALANAFATEFRAERRARERAELRKAMASIKKTLDRIQRLRGGRERRIALGQRIDDLQLQIDVNTGGLEIVEEAVPPAEAVSPRPRRDAALGGLFGLVLGCALALLWAQSDRRVRHVSQLQDLDGLPVLGTIPRSRALRRKRARALSAADAEAFRVVQANSRFFDPGVDLRSIIVTSAAPGDGKTTLAWNLAYAAASGGLRVLLIEADLRRPSLTERYGLEENGGLVELLTKDVDMAELTQPVTIGNNNGYRHGVGMDVLVAGRDPMNPAGLIASNRMRAIIANAEASYDFVVLDTPPVSMVSDAIPLLRVVSGVIVVSYLGRSTRDGLDDLLNQLRHLEVRVLGVVANGAQRGEVYPYRYG